MPAVDMRSSSMQKGLLITSVYRYHVSKSHDSFNSFNSEELDYWLFASTGIISVDM
jgi:hypothetical protein